MPGRNQPRSRRGRSAIARTAMNTNSTNGLGINNGGGMKKGGAHPSATGFMRSKPWQISVPASKKNYAFKMKTSSVSNNNDTIVRITVTAEPNKNGSGNVYVIDGTQKKSLTLYIGTTYIFTYPLEHPFTLSKTQEGSEYTANSIIRESGNTLQFTPTTAYKDHTLYYYCSNHNGMGGKILIKSKQESTHVHQLEPTYGSGELGGTAGSGAGVSCRPSFDCSGIGEAAGCLIAGDDTINPTKYCCTTKVDDTGRCLDASMVCLDKTLTAGTAHSKCLDSRTPMFPDCSTAAVAPTVKPQLFGNWYYGAGSVCNNPDGTPEQKSLSLGPACSMATFDAFLEQINNNTEQKTRNSYLGISEAVQNSNFYLGTGFYEADWTATMGGYITWESIDCDGAKSTESAITANNTDLSNSLVPKAADGKVYGWQVMNFGGWGCCGQDYEKGCNNPMGGDPFNEPGFVSYCNTKGTGSQLDKCNYKDLGNPDPEIWSKGTENGFTDPKYTSSTGPNAVWNTKVITYFDGNVSADTIRSRGYNAVSFDIEGVDGTLDGFGALLKKYRDGGLKTIITIPGNGVSSDNGGMDWFTNSVRANTDYVCLMYYALIGDTMCPIGGGSVSLMKESLKNNWTGTQSQWGFRPDQIILGLTFGIGDWQQDINDVFADDGVWGNEAGKAFGGVTRWAEFGGKISWGDSNSSTVGKSTYLCPGAPIPPPPPKDCVWYEPFCNTPGSNRVECTDPLGDGMVRCT